MPESFSFLKRIQSFKYAFAGLKYLIVNEHNSRIHLFSAIVAIILCFVLKISTIEWLFILLVIGMVFILEIVNSAIENLSNFVSPDTHPQIKVIKDLSAAAVLVGAITALLIGIIIFLPKIYVVIKCL
jgi:diacylglycerol kinase (ATP)